MVTLLWTLLVCSILLNIGLLAELTWVNRDFGKAMANSAFWEHLVHCAYGKQRRVPPHPELE